MRTDKYKISFCIVCMNRLHQIQQTLLQNIYDNLDYDNIEFVILDYNSADNLMEWTKANLLDHIDTGKVVYYHTPEPKVFNHSHSKNIAFKMASGDIVCNVNADHFIGREFAKFVNQEFTRKDNIILTAIDFHKTRKNYNPPKDVFGKVCVKKADFLKVNGFDETFKGYGFEDYDFVNRIELNEVERILIDNPLFLKHIPHEEKDRFTLEQNISKVYRIYIRHLDPSTSEIIYLYKDQQFENGTIVDNSSVNSNDWQFAYKIRDYRFLYSVKESQWRRGTWREDIGNHSTHFQIENSADGFSLETEFDSDGTMKFKVNDLTYYAIDSCEQIENLVQFNYLFQNRSIMEQNFKNKQTKVNPFGFGRAKIFKNYQLKPLDI